MKKPKMSKLAPAVPPPPAAPPPAPSIDERISALNEWVSALVDVVGVQQFVARLNERRRLREVEATKKA